MIFPRVSTPCGMNAELWPAEVIAIRNGYSGTASGSNVEAVPPQTGAAAPPVKHSGDA